jgi:hypothetical protein
MRTHKDRYDLVLFLFVFSLFCLVLYNRNSCPRSPPPPLLPIGTLKTTKNGSKSSSFATSAVSLTLALCPLRFVLFSCLALPCLVLLLLQTLNLPYTNPNPNSKTTTWMKWIPAVKSVLYWIRSTNASEYS